MHCLLLIFFGHRESACGHRQAQGVDADEQRAWTQMSTGRGRRRAQGVDADKHRAWTQTSTGRGAACSAA